MTKKRIYIGIGCALAMVTLFYSCRGDDAPKIAEIDTAAMEAIPEGVADSPQLDLPTPIAQPPVGDQSRVETPVDVTMIVEGLMTELEVVYEEVTGKKLERRSSAALRIRYEFRTWLNGLSEADRRLYSTMVTGERVTDPQVYLRREGLNDEMEGLVNKVLTELGTRAK